MKTQDVNFAELGITVTTNEALTADITANNTFEVAATGSGNCQTFGIGNDLRPGYPAPNSHAG